ncbi:MAG: amidohydrolase family protein, partial [Proteobacteria bacterium]|nr:amidohydrolase family protein [Pseudomonadota bacterium]
GASRITRKRKVQKMNGSWVNWICGAMLAGVLLFMGAAASEAASDRPPNIVFIFVDDQGYYDLGCYGASEVKTPRIDAMAKAGTTAVLLPGAFLTLAETQKPPIDALRANGIPIALATDCNPGTSPLCSIPDAMALGSRLFGLTPAECLAGVTREAARALGLEEDRGTLEPGKRADIAIWDIDHPRDLIYWMGVNPLSELLVGGRRLDT